MWVTIAFNCIFSISHCNHFLSWIKSNLGSFTFQFLSSLLQCLFFGDWAHGQTLYFLRVFGRWKVCSLLRTSQTNLLREDIDLLSLDSGICPVIGISELQTAFLLATECIEFLMVVKVLMLVLFWRKLYLVQIWEVALCLHERAASALQIFFHFNPCLFVFVWLIDRQRGVFDNVPKVSVLRARNRRHSSALVRSVGHPAFLMLLETQHEFVILLTASSCLILAAKARLVGIIHVSWKDLRHITVSASSYWLFFVSICYFVICAGSFNDLISTSLCH